MGGLVFRRVRIDRHAADGVEDAAFGGRGMMMVVVRRAHGRPRPALAVYTLGGYIDRMSKDHKTQKIETKAATLKRLGRLEGQIRGIAGMVEADRYCIDIVTQIAAARAALRKVEEEILREHVAHCVEHAIKSGDKADQRRKVAELMDVMGRAGR